MIFIIKIKFAVGRNIHNCRQSAMHVCPLTFAWYLLFHFYFRVFAAQKNGDISKKNIKTKNHIRYIKHIVIDTKLLFIVNFDVVFSKYHLKDFISYVCCIITQSFIKYFRFGTTFDTIPPFNTSVTLLSRFIDTFASENDKNIFFFKV